MKKTLEVRWFFPHAFNSNEMLLSSGGVSFHECEPRVDFYLKHVDAHLGIKIREGKIEVKEKQGESHLYTFSPSVNGTQQHYVKWSFLAQENNILTGITQGKYKEWLRVEKSIIGFDVYKKNGATEIASIGDIISSGCQIDYTRLRINDQHWYTLGFEWFGEQHVVIEQDWIHKIFGNIRLNATLSMGFPEFLSRFY